MPTKQIKHSTVSWVIEGELGGSARAYFGDGGRIAIAALASAGSLGREGRRSPSKPWPVDKEQ